MSERSIYVSHAENIIRHTVENIRISIDLNYTFPEDLLVKRACFVSIHRSDDSLRGCIGTIEPTCSTLYEEIKRNAIAACTRDSRFDPVSPSELNDLIISVDVLSLPEMVDDINSLNPQIYGIIISDNYNRKGVLLPNLPSVKTVQDQINIVKRKAGINSNGVEGLNVYRFTSKRYY